MYTDRGLIYESRQILYQLKMHTLLIRITVTLLLTEAKPIIGLTVSGSKAWYNSNLTKFL